MLLRCVGVALVMAAFGGISSARAQPAVERVTAGSVVALELAEPLSTATVKRGDTFAIRLAQPIFAGNTVVVPAGTPGRGEVIDANSGVARLGKGARPSKLLLAARYLDYNGGRILLRGFHLGATAINSASWGVATPSSVVTVWNGPGREATLPVGTPGEAKLAADLNLMGQAIATQPVAQEPVG